MILRKNCIDDMELQEEFNTLFLNIANGVIGLFHLSRVGMSTYEILMKKEFGKLVESLYINLPTLRI